MKKQKQAAAVEVQPTTTTPTATMPAAQPEQQKADTPKAAPLAAEPKVSKQQLTIMRFSVELKAKRNIELKPEMLSQDGKFINVNIGEGWPTIQIGNGGGVTLPAIRSYPEAFAAALIADQLLAKQTARDVKKAAAAVTATPKPTTAPVQQQA